MSRTTSVLAIGTLGFLMGIPSAINLSIFENQDFVWGVALTISGAFVAFSVMRYGVSAFREEAVNVEGDWHVGVVWEMLIKWIVPLEATILLVWWLWISATEYAPDSWYNPLDPFSVATCVVQWAIIMGIFYMMNNWLNKRGKLATVEV